MGKMELESMETAGDWFLPGFYQEVREMVCSREERVELENEHCIQCYVYIGKEGRYRKYYLPGDIDNLARFLCSDQNYKLVCDSDDYPVLCTIGSYLDLERISEEEKEELRSRLIYYQSSLVKPAYEILE